MVLAPWRRDPMGATLASLALALACLHLADALLLPGDRLAGGLGIAALAGGLGLWGWAWSRRAGRGESPSGLTYAARRLRGSLDDLARRIESLPPGGDPGKGLARSLDRLQEGFRDLPRRRTRAEEVLAYLDASRGRLEDQAREIRGRIAEGGSRTLTTLRPRDFESRASANSATPAIGLCLHGVQSPSGSAIIR